MDEIKAENKQGGSRMWPDWGLLLALVFLALIAGIAPRKGSAMVFEQQQFERAVVVVSDCEQSKQEGGESSDRSVSAISKIKKPNNPRPESEDHRALEGGILILFFVLLAVWAYTSPVHINDGR